MDKSYRIHTNISSDVCLNVNMQQDFDFLEILSLKLKQKDAYRLHSSNYGVIVGRVLANDAFGIPNAKVSIFIERDDNDPSDMEAIYPYKEVTTKDKEGRRYNILPDYSDDECYRVVGTFPNKRLVLDDDVQLDIYDKYWKYSTVTNNAGDFMLFAVPTGSVTVHIEMDLSDIGVLSQRPRDFEYKGYNLTLFDSPSQFKESTNLDDLSQIFSQNKSIYVYPFWGDADNGIACITRSDVQIQYEFEPTCVFMGSIVSDNEGHAIGHRCAPDIENGMNDQLVAGNGTIEMIRKTPDGLVEEYSIQGNQLIDENGVWCYQIPMNLDYIGTDEYGNIVPTDNPNKGIPTRTQVRFRISKNETSDEGFSRHTAKYLVPMNPIFSEKDGDVSLGDDTVQHCGVVPYIEDGGAEIDRMYSFGSSTPLSCFRDLYWNNVYSVKNYIPKSQVAHRAYSKNYTALKGSNLAEDQNPIPFNKLRIDLPFVYIVVCLLFTIVVWIVTFINTFIICMTINPIITFVNALINFSFGWPFSSRLFGNIIPQISYLGCIPLSAGVEEGHVAYIPGCECGSGWDNAKCPEDMEGSCTFNDNKNELMDKIQRNLALEYKIVKLDLYQDWINGCLYMPLWYWKKSKKKTFLFGLFTLSSAKNEFCSDNSKYTRLKTFVTCNIKYYDNDFTVSNNDESMPDNEDRWHKNRSEQVGYLKGLIKPVENKDGLTAYYYVAVQPTNDNVNPGDNMSERVGNFKAVRLFATDIILLGNLNPNNIYGIPQFYKCLPSTTANIPPLATIEEIPNPDEPEVIYNEDVNGSVEDSGDTITTGMDWNHNGEDRTPAYKSGLFIDLACTYASTRPKSCINVERISELGVSLDIRHDIPYHNNGDSIVYGKVETDGFISKYELDDMENRAMFATLNHIGFIPQEYQDMHDSYTTQVPDTNTGYLIPKFKYIYPVDFDGRLQLPMDIYNRGFNQALFDERDESYITFKLGAEKYNREGNSEERIRHFYHDRSHDGMYDMPLYNNSYYFYFGIKKGSTAIDKFNQMFDAPCTRNRKEPFTLIIEHQGRSYCPQAYTQTSSVGACPNVVPQNLFSECAYYYNENKNKAYGRIRVTSDDIKTPYSYKLYDQFGDLIIEEDGMTVSSFVIGGQIDDGGHTVSNCNGWIYKQILNDNDEYERIDNTVVPYYQKGLTNQEYILEVTDGDGKTIIEKVKLDTQKISGTYKATDLGTKFYNSGTTRIDYICHDDTSFYGKIEMTSFSVDGYDCAIDNVKYLGYDQTNDSYTFCITGSSDDISSNVVALLDLRVLNTSEENKIRNCLCDDNGSVNLIKEAQNAETEVHMMITPESNGELKKNYFLALIPPTESNANKKKIVLYVYQPNQYVAKITQGCNTCGNLVIDNTSEEIISINNGVPFVTTLNSMPTRFMLGSSTDTHEGDIANNSYFYSTTVVDGEGINGDGTSDLGETDYHIKGWYGLHQEDSYMFSRRNENKTYEHNKKIWENYINSAKNGVSSPNIKREILKFKFDTMFKLSEGAYMTSNSSCKFTFNSSGGVNLTLRRMVVPMYEDLEKARTKYIFKDFFQTNASATIANIVPDNYSLPYQNGRHNHFGCYKSYTTDKGWFEYIPDKPHYNDGFYDKDSAPKIGNYFAAFTNDGSYISQNKIDGKNIKIERSPSFASISPNVCNGEPKVKGADIIDSIDGFPLVHTTSKEICTNGKQVLSGDTDGGVTTLPYLRALFVDRRLDYDIQVLAPVVTSNINLYSNSIKQRNIPWKGGRLTGWIYNGIEMSYDNEYNVISADTHSAITVTYDSYGNSVEDIEYSAATFNKRLEYTYKYDSAHKCMTCGYQFSDFSGCCPMCGSDNIKLYQGEIVKQRETDKVVNTIKSCGNGEMVTAHTWEATSHVVDKNNFNSEATIIPRPTISEDGQEKYYTLDDAITYYHKWLGEWECDWKDTEPMWGEWNVNKGKNGLSFGFERGYDSESSNIPLIKEFYSSTLNGFDLRHLYWSLFNYERLNRYTTVGNAPNQDKKYGEEAIDNEWNPFYVYHYPYQYGKNKDENGYNGDFNRDDVVLNIEETYGRKSVKSLLGKEIVPYPTKRFIDIGNLPSVEDYNYSVQSCSYNMTSEITSDGRIKAITKGGESVEINFKWKAPIAIVTPNEGNNEYANISYNIAPKVNDDEFSRYVHFSASTVSLAFKYNSYECNGFEVYTKSPRLIQVLPYIDTKTSEFGLSGNVNSPSIDGIGYYKTSNKGDEFGQSYGTFGNGKTLDEAIEHITLLNGTFDSENDVSLPQAVSISRNEYKTKYGLNANTNGNSFFKKGDEFITSDSEDFTNIRFNKNNIVLSGASTGQDVKVFTVLVDREYRFDTDDNLVKHIRTIETSELFDCRDLFMKVTLRGKESANDSTESALTYVEMSDMTPITPNSNSTNNSNADNNTNNSNADNKTYTQVITFDMIFNISDGVKAPDRQNESLMDYSMMSYTFRFTNAQNEVFDVRPASIFLLNNGDMYKVLRFIVKWPSNMGILADIEWAGSDFSNISIPVSVYAKTQSNFVYKMSNFSISFCCSNGQESGSGHGGCNDSADSIKDGMEKSVRYISHIKIGGNNYACD